MSSLFPNTPAITQEAEDPEMSSFAYEVTSALEAAKKAGVSYLARLKDAGEFLTKARKKCAHGKWIPWLTRHNINRYTAFKAIKAYSKCVSNTHLEEVLGELAEDGQEQEKDTSLEAPGSPPEPSAEPDKPLSQVLSSAALQPILALSDDYAKVAKRAKMLAKKVREIEATGAFRSCTQGRSPEYLSDKAVNIYVTLQRLAPKAPCEACEGAVEASPDSDPCPGCAGKGWLTVAEFEALESNKKEIDSAESQERES